ncbi:MAG: hypothetical protein LCH30_03720 [Proteobacteria bacterium]|nr:hypothetical protein [Pseudomonadota bacterium]
MFERLKFKKIPYNILLILLTGGVSLILGFLSFGGMLAITPMLSLAIAAFFLAGAYEAEIYKKNIANALKKLFKPDYLKQEIANRCLLELVPDYIKKDNGCEFFLDYQKLLKRLHKFEGKTLSSADKIKKKHLKKSLSQLEGRFAAILFAENDEGLTEDEKKLKKELEVLEQYKRYRELLTFRAKIFIGVKIFCVISAAFMTVGTTYLLVEALVAMPFLTTLIPLTFFPALAIPMSIIAGIAYGLLTYNAITDMINNETIKKLFNKVKTVFTGELSLKKIVSVVFSTLTILLIAALTICSAGTWWTIAKNAQPLFTWMTKIPSFIMGIINPIITSLSQLAFGIENASNFLDQIVPSVEEEKSKKNGNKKEEGFFRQIMDGIKNAWNKLREDENWLQIFNPFRFILKIAMLPMRIALFLGHVISTGVSEDRVPGIPEIASAVVNIFAEIGTDGGYFFGIDHSHSHSTKALMQERFGIGHNHDHGNDIPSRILKFLFSPLFLLAAIWDHAASQRNTKPLLFREAIKKQLGETEAQVILKKAKPLSQTRVIEQSVHSINHHLKKHEKKITPEDKASLEELKTEVQKTETPKAVIDILKTFNASNDKQRFFAHKLADRTHACCETSAPQRARCS